MGEGGDRGQDTSGMVFVLERGGGKEDEVDMRRGSEWSSAELNEDGQVGLSAEFRV